MAIEPDDPRMVYLPEADVLKASGHCGVMRDRWFCVHPERGLIFWQPDTRKRKGSLTGASPQCNSNESISQSIQAKLYPWAEVKFIPMVIVPIDVGDY